MSLFKTAQRVPFEEETTLEAIDPRIAQILSVRTNRLQRLEQEKRQAQTACDAAYQSLPIQRAAIAPVLWMYCAMETLLETHYLSDDVYMQNLRRWMDESQGIKQKLLNHYQKHMPVLQTCVDAKSALTLKTQETTEVLLQTEKLNLLQENWYT